MNNFSDNSQRITKKIYEAVSQISEKQTEKAIAEILNTKSIFIFGAGRSGLAGRAFAMRLVHMGKLVHFVGSCTTPAITSRDVFIAISGSGKTSSVVRLAETAKDQGATVISISSSDDSPLAKMTDILVEIPMSDRKGDKGGEYLERQIIQDSEFKVVTPMGTLFELSTMIYFDSIVPVLMEKLGVSETLMKNNHANLE